MSYFNLSNNRNIIVGSGQSIPIFGCGHTSLSHPHSSFSLNNVLHVSCIIKNLIFIRQITIDNNIFVKFNHFGFFAKNLHRESLIIRCNSSDNLYPTSHPPAINFSFATLSSPLWHHHLVISAISCCKSFTTNIWIFVINLVIM